MTNDEIRRNAEIRMTKPATAQLRVFDIRASDFFRHSSFNALCKSGSWSQCMLNGGGKPPSRKRRQLLFVRHPVVMLPKQVISEIVLQITPDRVNVVRVVLCIVVFHQKGRALHAIVMAFLRLDAPSPGEIKAFCPALL